MCVFNIKSVIKTTSNDFTMCRTGFKKCLRRFFVSIHFFFYESCLSGLCCILLFQTNFIFFLIFLDLLGSVNIHVIKIIPWNLADARHITFSSNLTNILLCVGIGIGYKSIVKLKLCAQPMHQIYVIKYCIPLKTSLSK